MDRERIAFIGTCDLSGHVRGKGFPLADLQARLKSGIGLAYSNIMISAFGSIYDTPFGTSGDLTLIPDQTTEVDVAFDDEAPERFYLGDLLTEGGAPWDCCPRGFLRRALEALKQRTGLELLSTFEQEFIYTGVEPRPAFAYALESMRRQGIFGEALLAALRKAGVVPDSFLAEYVPGQFEVTAAPAPGLQAADDAVVTREMVRSVAFRLGHRAILSPILDPAGGGNGTHVHFSFLDAAGAPALHDAARPFGLSAVGEAFVAGIVHHLPAITAVTAASVASYYRLRPNRWAPTWANVGYRDRGAAVRICPGGGPDAESRARQFNVEFRVADAAASPYMVLGVLVQAGLDGIAKGLALSPAHDGFAALADDAARAAAGLQPLPGSLAEALDLLAASTAARAWFGETFMAVYLQFKRGEIRALDGLDEREICRRYAEIY